MKQLGMITGNKNGKINIPNVEFSKIDFLRGVVDADGSLGYTNNNFPFLSIVITDNEFAQYWMNFIKEITGKQKTSTRNKRDGVFNISITKEDAQMVGRALYYESCLSIHRKYKLSQEILKWERPDNMKIAPRRKKWNSYEDEIILNHSIEESMTVTGRSNSSIKMRLYRLNN